MRIKNKIEISAEKLKDYDLILVVYNKFSKILYFIIMTEKIIVEKLVKLFRDNM